MPAVIREAFRAREIDATKALLIWTDVRVAEIDAVLAGEFMSRGLVDVARAILGGDAARLAHSVDEEQIGRGDLRSRWRAREGELGPLVGFPQSWSSVPPRRGIQIADLDTRFG